MAVPPAPATTVTSDPAPPPAIPQHSSRPAPPRPASAWRWPGCSACCWSPASRWWATWSPLAAPAPGNLAERVSNVAQGRNEIQDERERVMDVASQFMLRVNTYGPDLLDDDGQMPE